MITLIETYAPEIIQAIVILTPVITLFRSRYISDKNILNQFQDVKDIATKLGFKEGDISRVVSNVNILAESLKNRISDIEKVVSDEIVKLEKTVLEFQEGELYQKMLEGLSQLDELSLLLKQKDTTIEQLAKVIKDIKKKLGD